MKADRGRRQLNVELASYFHINDITVGILKTQYGSIRFLTKYCGTVQFGTFFL